MASLLFLTIISSAYADVSTTSVTSDTYSKVPTQENRLISTMGTSNSYNWGQTTAAIYCSGRITVHTFPEGQYFFGDTLLVSVYKVGSPVPVDSYTLQNAKQYNNTVSFKNLYGCHYINVEPSSSSMKGTFYVDYN
jgi:L-ascorbate metabolism protein UlaG (beta-lactamase superfamily)